MNGGNKPSPTNGSLEMWMKAVEKRLSVIEDRLWVMHGKSAGIAAIVSAIIAFLLRKL